MRLDRILIDEQLVTDQQIEEALEYQKRYGGRLETHLFRFGYADEAALLKALSRQFNCRSVSLGFRRIPENIPNMIPAEFAFTYIILPFDYDPVGNRLMLACEKPPDAQLSEKLAALYPDKNFDFYIALGPALKAAIINCYRNSLAIPTPGKDTRMAEISDMGQADPMPSEKHDKHTRLLICNDNHRDIASLEQSIKEHRFDCTQAYSISEFVEKHEQLRPQIIILIKCGTVRDVTELVGGIISRGVSIDQTPSLLLSEEHLIDSLMHTLNIGIEDVVALDTPQTIVLKLNRIRARLEIEKKRRLSVIQDLGTHGTLEDMNVIDIIQAMGPSEKTARISITGSGSHLTMFLDRGNIIYAECEDKTGAEAVYLAIPWDKGIWSVDPIGPEELPEPNNFQSNESILLEGCYLLDESNRDSQFECDFLQ
ncbi:MAG: hypothetical protein CVT49_09720 [candidate division Zixibacteria bacterium HGW-Zixibacteria-1]|nr:MAG: hypothetical protein CVT49_09720 [candidate division Zixibacteria bacterium HGW-Zixibacteria-1]